MLNKKGSTKIVNFMNPWAGVLDLKCGHMSHIVKMHNRYLSKILFSILGIYLGQTKYIEMSWEEFDKIDTCNFTIP